MIVTTHAISHIHHTNCSKKKFVPEKKEFITDRKFFFKKNGEMLQVATDKVNDVWREVFMHLLEGFTNRKKQMIRLSPEQTHFIFLDINDRTYGYNMIQAKWYGGPNFKIQIHSDSLEYQQIQEIWEKKTFRDVWCIMRKYASIGDLTQLPMFSEVTQRNKSYYTNELEGTKVFGQPTHKQRNQKKPLRLFNVDPESEKEEQTTAEDDEIECDNRNCLFALIK